MYSNNYNQNQNNSMFRIPNRIFVGGIPQTASQDELREYFSHFGQVKDARIITDPRGNSRGYGFVTYESENDASKVLSLKEEDLIFKEAKLNIGHAFRKKNVNGNPNSLVGGNGGAGGQMGHMGAGGHHNNNGVNSFGNGNTFGMGGGFGGPNGLQGATAAGLNGLGNNPMMAAAAAAAAGANMGNLAGMGNMGNLAGMSNQSNGYLDLQLNGMHTMANGNGMNGYGQSAAGMNLPNLNGHLGMNMNGMGLGGLNGMGNLNGLGNMSGMNGGHMGHLHGMNGLNSISPLNGINMN